MGLTPVQDDVDLLGWRLYRLLLDEQETLAVDGDIEEGEGSERSA